EPLLDPRAPGRRLALRTGRAAREQVPLQTQPADRGELLQETPPLPRVVVAVGVLAVVVGLVPDEITQADLAGAQLLGEPEHVVEGMRRPEEGADHRPFAVLDALGDLDLTLSREERDGARLAQVDAHRIDARGRLPLGRSLGDGGVLALLRLGGV